MYKCKYRKITPFGGFDPEDQDNGMQNNYAWSMAQLGDYLYVGTGRNIPYSTMVGLGVEPPPELTPQHPTNEAEIWRYPLWDLLCPQWERVYKAAPGSGIMGFRHMVTYAGADGVPALYCASFGVGTDVKLLVTANGTDFSEMGAGIPQGFSTRAMAEHKGILYTGATNALDFSPAAYLFATDDPQMGWHQIDFGQGRIPTGEVVSMISFNGYLYIGTAPAGGFEVWKCADPQAGPWTLVVDQGAGDALNEVPMSMEIFGDSLYVGSGIWIGLQSVDPSKTIVPPKGYDVIRIRKNDTWQVVVGSAPIAPTSPVTGTRNKAAYPSGFGSMFNAYCWQIRAFHDKLFIGSWDWAILAYSLIKSFVAARGEEDGEEAITDGEFTADNVLKAMKKMPIAQDPAYNWFAWLVSLIRSVPRYPAQFGFDLWESKDGTTFRAVTQNGFRDRDNYGLRTMVVSDDGCSLFLGTANPYRGCQVWELRR